jgi:transglutaminase/protease-like cytokinesis protein 3
MTYALMFKEMCDIANIECEYIPGSAGGPHAWNRVKVNDVWYWNDVTWYDSRKNENYYLSKTLWPSHVIEQ